MSKKADEAMQRDAREVAKRLLRKENPDRWLHTQGVANRAAELAATVHKPDRVVLNRRGVAQQPTSSRTGQVLH